MADQRRESLQRRLVITADRVMSQLRPFQAKTVEHIRKLYEEGYRRILVADEVGLGKTMVARGVLAQVALLREAEGDDLMKVAYICSNSAIADQNLRSLEIDGKVRREDAASSRLSMQHLNLAIERLELSEELGERFIQLIPLTPMTSFAVENSTGRIPERALMAEVLAYADEFQEPWMADALRSALWLPQKGANRSNWDWWLGHYRKRIRSLNRQDAGDEGTEAPYPHDVIELVQANLDELEGNVYQELIELCRGSFGRKKSKYFEAHRGECRSLVIELRRAFSLASMEQMNPDFVIMDEFQRFADLLKLDETEMGMLAKRFLTSGEEGEQTRILLLSATPFRMFSTLDEDNDEEFPNSFDEFLKVMDFLVGDDEESQAEFAALWRGYGSALSGIDRERPSTVEECLIAKGEAETALLRYVARTERTSTGELAPLTSDATKRVPLDVDEDDVLAYLDAQAVLEAAGLPAHLIPPDYVKSCPFIFSYMRDYKAVKDLRGIAEDERAAVEGVILKSDVRKRLWVPVERILDYKPIGSQVKNAKYRAFSSDIFEQRMREAAPNRKYIPIEKLLWIPPSLPYYEPPRRSPFYGAEGLSKTLVFSAWSMVPIALSTLLSYESEQRLAEKLSQDTGIHYSYKDEVFAADEESDDVFVRSKSVPHGLLRWNQGKNNNAHLLIYPSCYLADRFREAMELIARDQVQAGVRPSLRTVKNAISRRIEEDIHRVPELIGCSFSDRRPASSLTYFHLVLLLDEVIAEDAPEQSLRQIDEWMADVDYVSPHDWGSKVLASYEEWKASLAAGAALPHDVLDVLSSAAIGAPAVCARRAYEAYDPEVNVGMPFEFGISFCTKMRTEQATMAVMVAMERSDSDLNSHWKNFLSYCCEGNFQAMLDEYFFLIYREGTRGSHEAVEALHREVVGSPIGRDKHPSLYKADTNYAVNLPDGLLADRVFQGEEHPEQSGERGFKMRANFAAAISDGVEKTSAQGLDRRSILRKAFNSPFRPFVLVSTSIGQEGLDFHYYCRKIIHWNLPSNPVDFEQREGRINRFRGLAIRQNLASRFGGEALVGAVEVSSDSKRWSPWARLFDIAEHHEIEGRERVSGLLPDWGLSELDDSLRIERFLYEYPFSSDIGRYNELLDACARYRAVLGQPDQEMLLGKIASLLDDESIDGEIRDLFLNLCPFMQAALYEQET